MAVLRDRFRISFGKARQGTSHLDVFSLAPHFQEQISRLALSNISERQDGGVISLVCSNLASGPVGVAVRWWRRVEQWWL